jgi:hypothetical protein
MMWMEVLLILLRREMRSWISCKPRLVCFSADLDLLEFEIPIPSSKILIRSRLFWYLKSTFINPLTKIIQDFTLIQQNYAIDIAKVDNMRAAKKKK